MGACEGVYVCAEHFLVLLSPEEEARQDIVFVLPSRVLRSVDPRIYNMRRVCPLFLFLILQSPIRELAR